MSDFRDVQRVASSVRWIKALFAAAVMIGAIAAYLRPIVEQNAPGASRAMDPSLDPGMDFRFTASDLPAPGSRASVVDGAWIFARKGQEIAGEGGSWLRGQVIWAGMHKGDGWVQLRLDESYNGLASVWVTGDSVITR